MDTKENQAGDPARGESAGAARAQRVVAVAWLTGITAVVALGIMSDGATVGTGLGVIGVCGMVAIVSYLLLKS